MLSDERRHLNRYCDDIEAELKRERELSDRLADDLRRAFIKRDDPQFWRSVFEGILAEHRTVREGRD